MKLQAQYFDGKTSAAQTVEVELLSDGTVLIHAGAQTFRHMLSALRISERVGNTPRRMQCADGALCVITDNEALDQWLHACGAHSSEHRVFRLERNWSYALAALLAVVIGTFAFIRYGVPVLAERVATQLPTSVDDRLGAGTLDILDEQFFAPTELTAAQQQALQQSFARIIRDRPDSRRYRLEFRKGGKLIDANAFALPSGTVVITDELVALAENDNELLAVLAHEVGHVVHRHSLRMVLQSSASTLVMFGLFGDVSGIASLATSVPAMLTQARYSRTHETEADDYAVAWLKAQGIATHYFGDLLTRLEARHNKGDSTDSSVLGYFSSHPQSEERAQRAKQGG